MTISTPECDVCAERLLSVAACMFLLVHDCRRTSGSTNRAGEHGYGYRQPAISAGLLCLRGTHLHRCKQSNKTVLCNCTVTCYPAGQISRNTASTHSQQSCPSLPLAVQLQGKCPIHLSVVTQVLCAGITAGRLCRQAPDAAQYHFQH